MLWNVLEWIGITATRMIGLMLFAFSLGKLIGGILGKRNQNTYVHEFLTEV